MGLMKYSGRKEVNVENLEAIFNVGRRLGLGQGTPVARTTALHLAEMLRELTGGGKKASSHRRSE